jgi:small-conductance mechanosensitive channel
VVDTWRIRSSVRLFVWLCVLAFVFDARAATAAPHGKTKDASAPDAAARDATADATLEASGDGAPTGPTDAALVLDEAAPEASALLSAPPPIASAAPSPPPPGSSAPSASHGSAVPIPADTASGSPVRIHDRKVFIVRVPRSGQSATQRAANATQALEHAIDDTDARGVRVEENGDVAIVFLGDSPIIQLGPDDAAAEGDASLSVNAKSVASKIESAATAERKRSALATTVFSISLLVFLALGVFLLLGRLGDLVGKVRAWVEAHPERLPNIRVAGIDVIRPAALRGGVLVAIDASKWVLRFGGAYFWVLFALSQFDATHAYSERLTGFVFAPLSALMGRAASAIPVLVVFAIAGLAVALLVRFVALFFGSVARGETTLAWLPADLALPTSTLVRAGIVLVAVTLAAPLVTGTEEGALGRAGAIALIAIGLSITPILATMAMGVAIVFGQRLRVGDYAEVGGRSGIVRAVSLLEVSLEDTVGCEIRVPHLASLLHPMRLLGPRPPHILEIVVSAGHPPAKVLALLEREAKRATERFSVALDWMDADDAGYTVVAFSGDPGIRTALLKALLEALATDGIALGRQRQTIRGAQ